MTAFTDPVPDPDDTSPPDFGQWLTDGGPDVPDHDDDPETGAPG
ncbi:unnamed protein product [Gemmata massiliana]|uniref:Uncharacterized protein n=1 Tax=Gemmata massiliana TaxID=1210884 RepID=A0A6P2CWA6_9BACT|nr:hypothetical protein [Gemmata massiliana]VTR92887.1 unnamed protein product [Gemmata massiliana]